MFPTIRINKNKHLPFTHLLSGKEYFKINCESKLEHSLPLPTARPPHKHSNIGYINRTIDVLAVTRELPKPPRAFSFNEVRVVQLSNLETISQFDQIKETHLRINLTKYFRMCFHKDIVNSLSRQFLYAVDQYNQTQRRQYPDLKHYYPPPVRNCNDLLELMRRYQQINTARSLQSLQSLVHYYCVPETIYSESALTDMLRLLGGGTLLTQQGKTVHSIVDIPFTAQMLYLIDSTKESAEEHLQTYFRIVREHKEAIKRQNSLNEITSKYSHVDSHVDSHSHMDSHIDSQMNIHTITKTQRSPTNYNTLIPIHPRSSNRSLNKRKIPNPQCPIAIEPSHPAFVSLSPAEQQAITEAMNQCSHFDITVSHLLKSKNNLVEIMEFVQRYIGKDSFDQNEISRILEKIMKDNMSSVSDVIWSWLEGNALVEEGRVKYSELRKYTKRSEIFYRCMIGLIFKTYRISPIDLAYELLLEE